MAESSAARSSNPPSTSEVSRALSSVLWSIHELEVQMHGPAHDATQAQLFEQRLVQYQQLLATTRDMLKTRMATTGDAPQAGNTLEGRKVPAELV
ncbi:hypothetical protein TSOC_014516, partial [Tetrabaena socialis]